MSEVTLTKGGMPETILPDEDPLLANGLQEILENDLDTSLHKLFGFASKNPESIGVWCTLGIKSTELMESYAYFRLAYHRGLDSLRKNGWKGSGFVRWQHTGNRFFLVALNNLANISEEIGDHEEATRCALFLRQLEPQWDKLKPLETD